MQIPKMRIVVPLLGDELGDVMPAQRRAFIEGLESRISREFPGAVVEIEDMCLLLGDSRGVQVDLLDSDVANFDVDMIQARVGDIGSQWFVSGEWMAPI